jgi:hypothetical protein
MSVLFSPSTWGVLILILQWTDMIAIQMGVSSTSRVPLSIQCGKERRLRVSAGGMGSAVATQVSRPGERCHH